ncbi:MAG TPA: respiratory nitrate reductase subunit gamma, partial [bacterium]|nr:respiratory nitrate reductase subunit gamma [bacterium]
MQQAGREYYWHVHNHWIMYILMVISFGFFAFGAYKKIMMWKAMKPAGERFSDIPKRAFKMLMDVMFQKRVRTKFFPGFFHSIIFWSFMMLVLATAILTIEIDTPLEFFHGNIYLVVSFFADIAGALLIIGLCIAIYRRYVMKPKSLQSDWQNAYMLVLLLLLAVGGFVLEGMRIQFTHDQWAAYSPIGLAFSKAMGLIPSGAVPVVYPAIWWAHAAMTFALIASLPYTKFIHFLLIPA